MDWMIHVEEKQRQFVPEKIREKKYNWGERMGRGKKRLKRKITNINLLEKKGNCSGTESGDYDLEEIIFYFIFKI